VIGQGEPETVINGDNLQVQQFLQGLPDGPVPFHYPAPDYREDLHLLPEHQPLTKVGR